MRPLTDFVSASYPAKTGLRGPFFIVRPAWARSWRCKSSRELTTVSEVKRNCVRVAAVRNAAAHGKTGEFAESNWPGPPNPEPCEDSVWHATLDGWGKLNKQRSPY